MKDLNGFVVLGIVSPLDERDNVSKSPTRYAAPQLDRFWKLPPLYSIPPSGLRDGDQIENLPQPDKPVGLDLLRTI